MYLFKHAVLLAICGLSLCCAAQETLYKCPPCASDCHDTIYNAPGICPVCEMALVEIKDNQFKGYSKKKVSIESKGISLNAAYYIPKNKNTTKGALVIVHGSAPSTYEDVSYYTKIGIKLGMAVLAYDKRGVGKSGGTYQSFTVEGSKNWFNLLASDVLAVISWLKKQPELENAKLGLLGGSQAGWIMPLAASKTKEVDFMIIGAGVAVSAGEEHFFSQLTGDGEENGISIQEAHKKLEGFQGEKGFDPRKILKQLRTRTLWFLGTNDPVIPVDATIEELERINNPNFEIVLLPHGDHNFRNTKTGEPYDLVGFIQPWLTESGIWDK